MSVKSDKDRIKEVMKYLKIGETKFESLVGWGNGSITKMNEESNLSTDKIRKVVSVIPNINVTWLVTGKGNMFLNKENDIIEVKGKEDNKAGTNSDQQDLNQLPDLKHLVEHQKKLLQKVEQIEKAVGDLKKDSDKVLLLLAQNKTSGTGNRRGRVG